ncbi:MAG: hypothetical protein IT579_05565 [Verrucomicrobia subdivision 3 bacterium]|nr:hypothetical protein [Limisphaerales bacterium]
MENCISFVPDNCPSSRNPIKRLKSRTLNFSLLALAAFLMLAASPAHASNLLVNPGFESSSGRVVPVGWTRFAPTNAQSPGNYWVEAPAHSGTVGWKQWGAAYAAGQTNVAGLSQSLSSAPGSIYQASGWMYTKSGDTLGTDCMTWVEVSFLGAGSQLLALYKSDNFTAAAGTDTWLQYPVTRVCDISAPLPPGDLNYPTYAVTGTVSQIVAPLGTTTIRYRYAYSQAGTSGGSANFDDALLNQISGPIPPVISGLFPVNMIFVNPSDGISFTASSPSGFTINNSAIHLIVNGVDVSGDLSISGPASSKTVTYDGLQSNLTYTASITVTDSFNFTASADTYFETTWVGIEPITYLWEAEDFDFDSGQYINNPDLCSVSGNPNCYFGKVGVEGIDEHNLNGGGSHQYRPDDLMATSVSGDYSRKNLSAAGRLDYRIDPFNFNEWVNYTRDWPNSTNWVIARLATDIGLSGTITLSRVNPDTSTTDLGTFTVANGRGWSTFDNVYLKDTNGFLANVVLNGKETLRVTSGGNLLPGFFMLVAAQVDLPRLSNLYPTGTRPFEFTNTLSFAVATTGASFPAGGIKVNLDGRDVSAGLVITGSASAKNVVYPGLLPNANHTAIITVTNSLGHGIGVTNHFDTFSETNYMVEAEDFDFDGGQFVGSWYPEAYLYLGATTNIDFQHSPFDSEGFLYRLDGIPEDKTHDSLRETFLSVGAFDYDLTWFGNGDWANYTRVYPTGNFYVYGRFSGLGGYSMYLDQIISGAGTTSQVTKRLGHWGTVGLGYSSYDWVPLTDDGLAAPAIVKLNGLSTLRIATTGNSNPNYFMLVPATDITLTAGRSGNNIVVSFPTQSGVIYRVFARDNLTTGNWSLLTTVVGDGTVKPVSDLATATGRFYKVVAP